MIAGARDDELIGLEIAVEDHLPGFRAFDPHVLRRLALGAENAADLGADEILDPVHLIYLLTPLGDLAHQRMHGVHGFGVGLPALVRLSLTALTSAEPTTTPSAFLAMSRACSAVLTPKPTAIGSCVWP